MKKINIGLIGLGTVGSGLLKLLKTKKSYVSQRFGVQFVLKTLCDRSIRKKNPRGLGKTRLTSDYKDVINDPEIDVVIELIGGMHPAKEIAVHSLKSGKDVITANKELIARCGKELFALARKEGSRLYFESSVGAGIPIIKTLTEGIAGNELNEIYGIINGTCNFILDEMSNNDYTFDQALKKAQQRGYAESNPTLDINGMDSAHKLAILTYLGFGKFVDVKKIYVEGITHISHDDIEHAESLNLCIKLLAIAKKVNQELEVRVHPTLISKDHPLSSINSIYNAIYINVDPMGDVLLSGEGAGQMAAASGVFSDLINLAGSGFEADLACNQNKDERSLKLRQLDEIKTKFYLRFMVTDKPGSLSQITSILGKHNIGINSVTQKAHNPTATVPVVMLTDYTTEKGLRSALNKIHKLASVKSKPVAIRMEKLW